MNLTRRISLLGGGAFAVTGTARAGAIAATAIAEVERRIGGRIGAAASVLGSEPSSRYRADERFPLCSTFKALASAYVLARVDLGLERLDRRVVFGPDNLVPYSPVTETRVGPEGMTLAEICHAAITRSDNTAGNLLLDSFGGPAALTSFLRSLGDPVTRLDRTEPTLNEAAPGDLRDTTTPAAMARTLTALSAGNALLPASRDRLWGWLAASTTGGARIRAGTPSGWEVGDKTGTGERGAASDVAILRPPRSGAPLVLTIYLHGSTKPIADLNAAIAEVARIMISSLRPASDNDN